MMFAYAQNHARNGAIEAAVLVRASRCHARVQDTMYPSISGGVLRGQQIPRNI
jgi:hypothetical protein